MTRLTMKALRAIEEALCARLAGDNDGEGIEDFPDQADYERAWEWTIAEMDRREARRKTRLTSV